MNTNEIHITYRDQIITYHVDENEWRSELFSHNRGSPSLKLAQQRIDKILDGSASKPKFEKVQVWYHGFCYREGWGKITLTSKTEDGYFATNGKDRRKLGSYDMQKVFADSPQNEARIAKIKLLQEQANEIKKQIHQAEQELTPFQP